MYSLYRRHLSEAAKRSASTSSTTTTIADAVSTASAPSTISAAVDSACTSARWEDQHAPRQIEAPAITVTAAAAVSSCHTSNPAPAGPSPLPPASSSPLSTVQILLSPRGGGGVSEDNISHGGILTPPAVSPSPPPQSQLISQSVMGKPRPLASASHKQTVFDGEGVFTITRSPSIVSQQPSRTILPHQPHDEDNHDLHYNNNNNNNNNNNKTRSSKEEVSEKYQVGLGLGSLKDVTKGNTSPAITNTAAAGGAAAAFGGGAVVASTAAAAASASNEPLSAYMRRVCCEALCDPLCLICCLACNANCCSFCGNMDLCCLLCQICARL